MKRIWALFFTLSLFATTITGIYIPPEGENPEGVKISIGKYSFKTGRGGFFFRSGVPTGTYPFRVKGKDFGKINVRGEILRLWIDGVEGIFYITRNFASLPPQTVKKEEYSLKDDLELSPALQAYQGSLHFQGLTEQEFFLQGLRIPSLSPIPYALTGDLKIEVGYPGAEVKNKGIPPGRERCLHQTQGKTLFLPFVFKKWRGQGQGIRFEFIVERPEPFLRKFLLGEKSLP